MNILIILLLLIIFSLLSVLFSEYHKICIVFSILIVLLFYFFLSKSFFHTESFYPDTKISTYKPCGNYYNLLLESLKHGKFFITNINNSQNIHILDTSIYKDKVYLYFGLTPLLLFYIPFKLITSLYLTDKFITFILGCVIFLLYLLILKIFTEKLNLKVNHFIIILSIFLIGICNYEPFLIIRGAIYEVCILTSMTCLLISIIILLY